MDEAQQQQLLQLLPVLQDRINQLEAQVTQLGQAHQNPQERNLVKLPTFSCAAGESWQVHQELISNVISVNRWNDSTSRLTVKSSLRGSAAARAFHIKPQDFLTIDDFLNALQALFVPRSAAKLAQTELDMLVQNPGEDVAIYHSRTRLLFLYSYPNEDPETSEINIRAFIKGLESPSIKEYVSLKDPSTFTEALKLAQEKDGVEKLVAHFRFGVPAQPQQAPVVVPESAPALPSSNAPTPMEIGAAIGKKADTKEDGRQTPRYPECPVCAKTNHPVEKCFLLRRMKKAYEAQKKDDTSKNDSKN